MLKTKFRGNCWEFRHEFDAEGKISLTECNLPKLGFELTSWSAGSFCLCIPATRKHYHRDPPLSPLYPFPPSKGKQKINIRSQQDSLEVELDWGETWCEAWDTVFSIKPGAFYDCIIPETVSSLWGPVPLETLPAGLDNTCRAVTHSIVSGLEERKMSVYLIHSLPLLLSAVQVFVGSEMAVVGHTVGPDTIGEIGQLELDTTFSNVPWRAMIIKDNSGDYAVCVAGWKGVRKAVPGRPGVPGQPGDPGYFSMICFYLRTGAVERVKLQSRLFVDLPGLSVDWDSGQILVTRDNHNVAQSICLAFVTSTLYLLVQPRPEDVEDAESRWMIRKQGLSRPARYKIITPPFIRNAAIMFLLFSGWKERNKIPSNSTVYYQAKNQEREARGHLPLFFLPAGCVGGFYSGNLIGDGDGDYLVSGGDYQDNILFEAGFADALAQSEMPDVGLDDFASCGGDAGLGHGGAEGGGPPPLAPPVLGPGASPPHGTGSSPHSLTPPGGVDLHSIFL